MIDRSMWPRLIIPANSGFLWSVQQTGIDVVAHPEYLIEPRYFLRCAVSDFINCGCLPFAKADDVLNVTKRLNGGTVGLQDRIEWLKRWRAALGDGSIDFAISGQATPSKPLPVPPEIKLPPPGQPPAPGLAPTFWGRVADLFRPKGD